MPSPERITAQRYLDLAVRAAREMTGGRADDLSTRLFFNLLRLGNRLAKDLEVPVRASAGLSFSGYQLLYTLRTVGPVNPNQLAHLASVSTASMSSLLNTLERKGMVLRAPDREDGRRTIVSLTPRGHGLVEDLHQQHMERERSWSQALTHEEAQVLDGLVSKLLDHRPGAADGAADDGPPHYWHA